MELIDSPIGFLIAQTAKTTTRQFEQRLVAAGGSLASWLVLLSLHEAGWKLQAAIAEDVGILASTLTHHLNAMEKKNLILRKRTAEDRRSHRVEITKAGRAHFIKMRANALAYDAQLRQAMSSKDMAIFRKHLVQITKAAIG